MFSIFAVVCETVAGLLLLAWAPVAASRDENEKMTKYESARLFIWNICWFVFRVVSFSMLAAYSKGCLIIVILTHIIGMIFWLYHDYDLNKVTGGTVTGLFMFYYIYYVTKSDSSDYLVCFDLFYTFIVII